MAKRASLSGNVAKPDAGEAAEVARKLSGNTSHMSGLNTLVDKMTGRHAEQEAELTLTASYVLPENDVDLLSQLAALRLERDKTERRTHRRAILAAKKAGQPAPHEPPAQARRSASAIVREAIDAHRPVIEAEIEDLKAALGKD